MRMTLILIILISVGKLSLIFNGNKTKPCWGFGASPVKIISIGQGGAAAH